MNSTSYENQQEGRPEDRIPGQQPQPGSYEAPFTARTVGKSHHKSPSAAAWLSIMPGLGQVYVGYYQQGFINILVVASTITVLAAGVFNGLEPLLGVFLAFFWIFNLIDANRRAHHFNRVVDGLEIDEVPDDFKLPSAGGSLFGGAVLVIVGVLFILDLNFDISLAWIKNWWPLMLIAFGGNLIYRARRDRE